MNNKTITFDFKSMLIGLLAGFAFFMMMGASSPEDNGRGKYQAVASEEGFMILDTQTGAYIFDRFAGRGTWNVGTFSDRFKEGEKAYPVKSKRKK